MKKVKFFSELMKETVFCRFQGIVSAFVNQRCGGYYHNSFELSDCHVFRPSQLRAVALSGLLSITATFSQTGTVLDNDTDAPLQNAIVSLKSTGALVLTNEDGTFEFPGSAVTVEQKAPLSHSISFNHGTVSFTIDNNATPVTIQLYTINGRKVADIADKNFSSGKHTLNLPFAGTNVHVLKLRIGRTTTIHRLLTFASPGNPAVASSGPRALGASGLRAVASTPDTLIVSKYLYTPKMQPLSDNNTIKLTKPSTPPPPPGMKPIPGGTFMMGASNPNNFEQDEIPAHEVTLSPFYMDSTEVTQADYALLMGIEPWTEFTPKNPGFKYPGADNLLPAWYLTWDDAILYCNARSKRDGLDTVYTWSELVSGEYGSNSVLADVEIDYTKSGYRLPTEAEWEYAARAGTRMEYYWADLVDSTALLYARYMSETPLPVASLLPNDYLLYDIVGNVAELTNDFEGYYTEESVTNPVGPPTGSFLVIRGGGWDSRITNACRVARRMPAQTREYNLTQGIRIVLKNNDD